MIHNSYPSNIVSPQLCTKNQTLRIQHHNNHKAYLFSFCICCLFLLEKSGGNLGISLTSEQ